MNYIHQVLFIICIGITISSCGSSEDDPAVTPITISFEASETSVYTGRSVSFINNTEGASDWKWSFSGANPATSTA